MKSWLIYRTTLGLERPTFIYDYPAKLAALAKIKMNDPTVAERFELYIGGLELANGFSELADASEQRQRFEEALKLRSAKNWARYEMPEKFLQSLDALPPCAGIALGIDRLVMIITDTANIDEAVTFTPEMPLNSTTFIYLSQLGILAKKFLKYLLQKFSFVTQ